MVQGRELLMELGQVASRGAVTELVERLREEQENAMVRHEFALGSTTSPGLNIGREMARYICQETPAVVRESCLITLDWTESDTAQW